MFDNFLSVLLNSHFEAHVSGPLIGAIAGLVFGNWASKNRRGSQSPGEARRVVETRVEKKVVKEIHHHYSQGSQRDDGPMLLIAAGFGLMILMFFFTAFLPKIATSFYFFTAAITTFAVTASITAVLSGEFNTVEWWVHTIFPIAISLMCFWLMMRIQQAIDPQVVAFAQSLLANQEFSFRAVVEAATKFFKSVNNSYVQWIIFEMLAMFFVTLAALGALGQCVYYIALSKSRGSPGAIWDKLATLFSNYEGVRASLIISAFSGIGWFCASGEMYRVVSTAAIS